MKRTMLFFAMSLAFTSLVNAEDNTKTNKTVDVKCHIELNGGRESIYFATVNENALKNLDKRLINRKIPTVYSKNKQQVNRVYECVKMTDDFSTAQARVLFAKYPK